MSGFNEREKGQMAKIHHDEEMHFRAVQRRNKLLGLWAAELLGKSGADADAYAREVIESDFEKPGVDDVIEKIMKDFEQSPVDMTEERLRKQLDRFFAEAVEQIKAQ
ncbi:MAG: DUF1476 domain-containing protein [Alphaproteobacteria bacterium]